MKTFVFFIFATILFKCSNVSNQSAFIGEEVPTHQIAPIGTIPSQSIYQLPDTFQSQDKKLITLSRFAGKPTVVGMIFTHCTYACPRLTADIKNIQQQLKSVNGKVNYLLVSFDSERDFPAQLKKFAEASGLDQNWTLLHGSETAVRTLSVLLNVQFEKDQEGNFSHSNVISILDKQGNLVYQKEGLGEDPNSTVAQINQMIASK